MTTLYLALCLLFQDPKAVITLDDGPTFSAAAGHSLSGSVTPTHALLSLGNRPLSVDASGHFDQSTMASPGVGMAISRSTDETH